MTTTAVPPAAGRGAPHPASPHGRPPARARRPDHGRRARRDAAVRAATTCLLVAGLVLVVAWWARAGGVADLGDATTAPTSLGRVTGLVASALLLAQVLLMARVPLLEHAFGQDRLAAVHRVVGHTSFQLMLAHVLLVTWGYAGSRVLDVPATFWDLTVSYPGMLLALAGSACLVLVVVTSIRAARRRLRYESWHLMHLYAYLGVGLALPHQLWTGDVFRASPVATAVWWTAWAATAGAVLLWRVVLPVWRTARHGLRVAEVVREAEDVVSVHLVGRRLARLGAEAGQFLWFRFPGHEGWTRAHPYSLSAAPDGSRLRITVKDAGDGSAATAHLRPGSRVLVEGPYGRLSPRARTRDKVLLVGAGVGITPLRALAEGLDYRPGEAVLLQRFTTEPLFVGELDVLARDRGLRVVHLPGRRRTTGSWLGDGMGAHSDTSALLVWVPDLVERDVFVCGPAPWADAVRRAVLAAGLPPAQLHLETFGW